MPTKRTDGRYQTSYVDRDGKKKIIYARSEEALLARKAEIHAALDRGVLIADAEQPTQQFLETWLRYRSNDLRLKTAARYETQLRLHAYPAIGKVPLRKLSPQHLAHLYSNMVRVRSAGSVAQLHAILHSALRTAVKWQLIPANPADGVDAPRASGPLMKWLTADEARALLDGLVGDSLRVLYQLAIATGMRQGEILGLRWQDVDFEASALRVVTNLVRVSTQGWELAEPKTKKSRRRIDLPASVVAALREHRLREAERLLAIGIRLTDDRLVFTDQYGEPYYGPHLTERHFKPVLRKLGLPEIRFHDLRHTAATLMLEQGVHPKIVSEMLGHSSVQITLDRYSHAIPTIQKEAAARMDRLLTGA